MTTRWTRLESADAVARAACERVLAAAAEAIRLRGRFRIVLAGGNTPRATYRLLADAATDWSRWGVYFGDERCLPAEHPGRNSSMARDALLDHVPIPAHQVHVIAAEHDPVEAAREYAEEVAAALPFDLVLLGLGEDGHIASLFPGRHYPPGELVVVVEDAPKPPPLRISLGYDALAQARAQLFLVSGAGKAAAVADWHGGVAIPASRLQPAVSCEVLVDRAALARVDDTDTKYDPAGLC